MSKILHFFGHFFGYIPIENGCSITHIKNCSKTTECSYCGYKTYSITHDFCAWTDCFDNNCQQVRICNKCDLKQYKKNHKYQLEPSSAMLYPDISTISVPLVLTCEKCGDQKVQLF